MSSDERPRPLLARVPAFDLTIDSPEQSGQRRLARRGRVARRFRLVVAVLFLGLGAASVAGLGHAAERALRNGLDGADLALLALLTLMTAVVAAQALALTAGLPVVRRLWRMLAMRRMARLARSTRERPWLARVGASRLLHRVPPAPQRRQLTRLRLIGATATWIGLTTFVISLGAASAALLIMAAGRSLRAVGVRPGSLTLFVLALLVTYGVTTMSLGLVRSWFEKRLRRPERQLRRLLRLMLRSSRRGTALLGRQLRWVARAVDPPIRVAAAVGLAAAAVSLSLLFPTNLVGAAPGPANPQVTTGPGIGSAEEPAALDAAPDSELNRPDVSVAGGSTADSPEGASSPTNESDSSGAGPEATGTTSSEPVAADPSRTTVTTGAGSTTVPKTITTSTIAKTTTTTTVAKTTTTSTVAKTTTTSSSTTTAPDTTGPAVTGAGANPDLILVGQMSVLSATVTDESGVASVVVYYRPAGGKYQVWGAMTPGKGTSYTSTFGPFGAAGDYEYRIKASDDAGNPSCTDLASCPGGIVTVTIL